MAFHHTLNLRVRYSETDRMGYVYYGVYPTYFEMGRVEALRALGIRYRTLEDQGILLPVADLSIQYKQPAHYDDLLTVRTTLTAKPGVRLPFAYRIQNESGVLICTATTELVFVDASTNRPMRPPVEVVAACEPHFD